MNGCHTAGTQEMSKKAHGNGVNWWLSAPRGGANGEMLLKGYELYGFFLIHKGNYLRPLLIGACSLSTFFEKSDKLLL